MQFLSDNLAGAIFLVSFLISGALIATKSLHLHRSTRADDGSAVQAAHSQPTPRIGGIAVIAAIVAGFFWVPSDDLRPVFGLLAISLAPIFVAGLAEDMGWHVSPRGRLLAAAVSATVAVLLLRLWVDRVDLLLIDQLFMMAPLAIAFTVFASAGICNAFNLIDGMNGLAAGTGMIIALGLGGIALQAGDTDLATVAFALVPAILGFFVFNFPFGKIFLGDAGAYTLGHVLVWTCIVLIARAPEVSPWAIVLVFFWPVSDTLFAIWRRSRSGRPVGQPDQMHFHQLVMRGLEIRFLGKDRRHITNPLTTALLLPFIAAPVIAGVLLWNNTAASMLAVAGFGGAFIAAYRTGLFYFRRYARARRKHRNGKAQAKALKANAG